MTLIDRPDESLGAGPGGEYLELRDVQVHFSLRGSFLDRMLGRDTGAVRAVDGITLSVRRGEVLGLVGESGSGKTTLAKAVLGLVPVTAGSISLDGEPVSELGERGLRQLRRRMQPVFQDPHASLNPTMTILQAVGHPLKIHGIGGTPAQRRERVSEVLEVVGLVPPERFLNKYPSDLSGGQRQRAVIARAIILEPDLVVADEPVSMLDMSVRAKVLDLLIDLKQRLGLTYLFVTHDLATARLFCDRIVIMYLGKVVEIGPAAAIYADPKHPYTRSLLAAIPDPDPAHRIPRDLPRGEVPDAALPPFGCSFHPRCTAAFAPCGWESRDLQRLLEMRWAALGPEAYERERDLLGSLAALGDPSSEPLLEATRGASGEVVRALLAEQQAATPAEPLWRGVEAIETESHGVRVRFHRPVTPVLQEVSTTAGNDTAVACHLYREDLGAVRGTP